MLLNTALFICCCLPLIFAMTATKSGENVFRLGPSDESECGGSRADMNLPFYTSGFV